MFGPSSVFENSIWWQFRIGQEKSTPYDKATGQSPQRISPKIPSKFDKTEKKNSLPTATFSVDCTLLEGLGSTVAFP